MARGQVPFHGQPEVAIEKVQDARKRRMEVQKYNQRVPSLLEQCTLSILSSAPYFCKLPNRFQTLPSTLLQQIINELETEKCSRDFLKLLLNQNTLHFDFKCVLENDWIDIWSHIKQHCGHIQKIKFPENFCKTSTIKDLLQFENLKHILEFSNWVYEPKMIADFCTTFPQLQTLHVIVNREFFSKNDHLPILNLQNLTDLSIKLEYHFPHSFEEEEKHKMQIVQAKILFFQKLKNLRNCSLDILYRISDNWDDALLSCLPRDRTLHLQRVTLDYRLSSDPWPDAICVDELELISRFQMQNVAKIDQIKNVKSLVLEEMRPEIMLKVLDSLGPTLRSLTLTSYDRNRDEFEVDIFSILAACPLLEEFNFNCHYKISPHNWNLDAVQLRHLNKVCLYNSHRPSDILIGQFWSMLVKRTQNLRDISSCNLGSSDLQIFARDNSFCKKLQKFCVVFPSVMHDPFDELCNFIRELQNLVLESPELTRVVVKCRDQHTKDFLLDTALPHFLSSLPFMEWEFSSFDPM